MNKQEAKAKVLQSNPGAVFTENEFGDFDAFDFTYSDEVRAKIYEFDNCFGCLYHSTGEEVK